jgi:hypothetical protein
MKRNSIPRDVSRRFKECGVKLIRANEGNKSKIGIHLANPGRHALWDALDTAMRDGFYTVYVHYDMPYSYSEETPEQRRARFVCFIGGAA